MILIPVILVLPAQYDHNQISFLSEPLLGGAEGDSVTVSVTDNAVPGCDLRPDVYHSQAPSSFN